jgi:hypothetical protein
MKTFRSAVYVALALLAVVAMSACAGNPSAPSSGLTTSPPVIQSNPAPGTTAHQVAIEGSETPLVIWIKELRPEKGARLQVGQVVSVMAQLGGPAGYEAKIAPYFRSGEKAVSGGSVIDFVVEPCGVDRGSTFLLKPSMTTDSFGPGAITVSASTPRIDDVAFVVRVRKSSSAEWPACGQVLREDLNLQAP